MVPGDPLTPGWASVPGAKRIPRDEAVSLPKIMSAPLSARDARAILETMSGPEAPKEWQGGLPLAYRLGPGATLRMKVVLDDKVRPIQTVIGRIRGTSAPDDEVILGNHRDAWIYGGVDPSSGTASMMDLARSLGALARAGVRPKRTIVFASWDAEEFTLTSSTEWGEQNEAELRDHAIAYLNVDSSTSGPTFTASAVPSLNQLIAEVAASIPDPKTGLSVAQAKQKDDNRQTSGLPNAAGSALVSNRLGSGSDYTVFLNFIGVPDRGHGVRRRLRGLSLAVRRPPVGVADWRSRLQVPRGDDEAVGRDGVAAGERGRAAARLPSLRERRRRLREGA